METDFNELEILLLLKTQDHFTSEEFFKRVPFILQGGEPARTFGKRIRWLLDKGWIGTQKIQPGLRLWWITADGKLACDFRSS